MAWSFGKRIKIARIERGLSQQTLATQAQVRQSHLSMIEHDYHYPNVGVARRLAYALGVNMEYLFGMGETLKVVTYKELEEEAEDTPATVDSVGA